MKKNKTKLWLSGFTSILLAGLVIGFLPNPPEIDVATHVENLNPLVICSSIGEEVGVNLYELNIKSNGFPILLGSDFSFQDGEALRFTYEKNSQIKESQLRIFHEEPDFITKSENRIEHGTYPLYFYLEALKYLPQEEILALCGENMAAFIVDVTTNFQDSSADRTIFYAPSGVQDSDRWHIGFQIQPMYPNENGGTYGTGEDMIYVYYTPTEEVFLDETVRESAEA